MVSDYNKSPTWTFLLRNFWDTFKFTKCRRLKTNV